MSSRRPINRKLSRDFSHRLAAVLLSGCLALVCHMAWAQSGSEINTAPPPSAADWNSGPPPDCLVNNAFYDTYMREVLNTIAAQCGITIIADETVMGIVTTDLFDVPIDEALSRVLLPYGLTYRWMGNYYLVGAPHPDNPSFPLLTTTELYRPSYVKATDIPNLLSPYYEPFIRVSRETNTVSLVGSPELLARIKRDLEAVDRAPRQLMIEALVTEVTSDVSRQIGLSWSGSGVRGDSSSIIGFQSSGGSRSMADTSFSGFFERLGIRSGSWLGQFKLKLDAMIEEGKAEIRANPRIATVEGHQARIFIGREEYFSILTGSVSFAYAQLEVIKTGIVLTITPYLSEDSLITLEVEPEVSDVVGSGSQGLPVTSKRSVKTTVRVRQGETVVIGGLMLKNRIDIERKIPLLGSIPILGALFRHSDREVQETEISVLITPQLWQE